MDANWNKNYPTPEESLDENNSLTKMLKFIGENKRVVDFGCATGYFSQILNQKQCVVTGIEINPEAAKIAEQYCQEVIVADLDFVSILEILPTHQFDVAIFGDVLEHLRNPWQVLRDTKQILKKDGYIVASIPNIAHGAIRLSLLQGKFEYTELGILDNTHLRFFTRKTVKDLLENSGYLLNDLDQTKLQIFTDDNLVPQLKQDDFDINIIQKMQQDEDIDTLQFIIRAYPCSTEELQKVSRNRCERLIEKSQIARSELQQTRQILEQLQSELQQTSTALAQSQSELQQTSNTLAQSQSKLQQTNLTIQWMETSKFWRLRLAWLKFRDQLKTLNFSSDHPVSLPAEIAGIFKHLAPAIATNSDESYSLWRSQNVPRLADLHKLAETIELLPSRPLISVIVPVFNTPEPFLRAAIESVIAQIYPNWELCIADDCSTLPHIRQVLAEYQARDSRIKVKFRETNGHISNNSNSALELATGDFVALLDHDDLLTPDAFYEVALLLNRHPEADMIYSDEDKIDERGQLKDPFFKPDWCPDSFLSRMYTCHLGVYRRSLISEIDGFRPGFEGSQDYDLVLRVTEKTKNIFHIPKMLYHWRIHSQSVASGSEAKPYAYQAAEKALNEALIRRQELGQVIGVPGYLGHYCIRYALPSHPRISIIIPTRDLSVDLDKCLASIFTKSTYSNYEVLVIDNNSVEASTAEVINQWTQTEPTRFRHLAFKQPFNFSKLNNYAVSNTQSELIVFLNNDTEVITPDWLEAMTEQAQRPTIGAVGCLLLYPDETIQHAGIVLGLGGAAGHGNHYASSSNPGYFGQLISISNFSAVTAACLMCRREVFDEVGGFDEVLSIAFNDVDLCLKMKQAGYNNVYLPHARLYHHESKSRGYENTTEKQLRFKQETSHLRKKWGDLIDNDPCYNPHLSRTSSDYSLNV